MFSLIATCALLASPPVSAAKADDSDSFQGRYFRGRGDVEYLQLLDISRRMFAPDPEFQNMAMLYSPVWNGLVEGAAWDAWWIQCSYGTTYCALPFYEEPFVTFLQNSQDLWFDGMGDGKTVHSWTRGDGKRFDWTAPDGCLCDCARPGMYIVKQGDGQVDIHDWGMEFTAAGVVMQSELLLISRDRQAIDRYLPKLERCVEFVETRRDPKNNLFLAGPAGNLLAPSYAGYRKPDGTYGQAYLAALSITHIAALNRLIELEKLADRTDKAQRYIQLRDSARKGLSLVTTPEGYFIRSLDPDGTRHGAYGADKHGYFEASPNHDAICLRVVDEIQARRIYDKIASIPGLRPHDFIIPNYPGYDDMYEKAEGLWRFGYWVNGGNWSTCEARAILAYCRLGQQEDARRSMKQLLKFARRWHMDAPFTEFGNDVYQPDLPINLTYDNFGPPAAMIRGLFEYVYQADGLTIIPHLPPKITELKQDFPIRFGKSRLYLSVVGTGEITGLSINGQPHKTFDRSQIVLRPDDVPETARIVIALGGTQLDSSDEPLPRRWQNTSVTTSPADTNTPLNVLAGRVKRISQFQQALDEAGVADSFEGAFARLAIDHLANIYLRQSLTSSGKLNPLPEPARTAAEACYIESGKKLCDGLEKLLDSYGTTSDATKQRANEHWKKTR